MEVDISVLFVAAGYRVEVERQDIEGKPEVIYLVYAPDEKLPILMVKVKAEFGQYMHVVPLPSYNKEKELGTRFYLNS